MLKYQHVRAKELHLTSFRIKILIAWVVRVELITAMVLIQVPS